MPAAQDNPTSNFKTLAALSILSFTLMCCEDGRSEKEYPAGASNTEQQALINGLYGHSTAVVYWWPTLIEAPPSVQQSAARAIDVLTSLPPTEVSAFSIKYDSNDLPQISLWIRRAGNPQLLIYNHGHSGLPESSEQYVSRFLQLAIHSGYDVLLTSMPLTGLNAPLAGTDYHILTRDSPERTPVDSAIFSAFSHYIYEIIDDPDLYIHYFVDSAVIPTALLNGTAPESQYTTAFARLGNSPPTFPGYVGINYVGLSGGATSGLTACAILSLRRCVLVAGVMPDDLRAKYVKNFGDAEQQSRSIYAHFSVSRLLEIANKSTDVLVLLFNDRDSCCFADPSATEFQRRYPEYDIRVLALNYHGYEPETILAILNN